MIKQAKAPEIIALERAEMAELADKILRMTNTIPMKIRGLDTDYYGAVRFKEYAIKARKTAEAKVLNLAKLRAAYTSIEAYYRDEHGSF